MQYTTHFNLMLPEGTDIVNPLVQQNPNFSDIDTAMYANKQGAVGSATELTAGTVHTITRSNTDSNIIRFTATSNWTAGDSMVIDSTPVSVYLSDGTTPETGAYIINTEVLAILSGTRVTLITSKTGMTAADVNALIAAALQPVVLATVTADGVKTNEDLYQELHAQLDYSKVTGKSYILSGTSVFICRDHDASSARFVRSNASASGGSIQDIKIAAAPQRFNMSITTAPAVTVTDGLSGVPTSGYVISIYA